MSLAQALAFTLPKEGGYVYDPDDPGGPTNRGITLSTLAQWRGKPVTAQDVENLGEDETAEIYKWLYWDTMNCAGIFEAGVATAVFDAGVLFGVYGAALCIQRAAACQFPNLHADAHIGPLSVAAINASHPVVLLGSFKWNLDKRCDEIVEHKPTSAKYLKGWKTRVDEYVKLVK